MIDGESSSNSVAIVGGIVGFTDGVIDGMVVG